MLAAIPLAIDLFGPMIAQLAQDQPSALPFPVIIALGVVQNLVLLAVMIFVGLKLGPKMGLGTPLLSSWFSYGESKVNGKRSLTTGLIVGTIVGAILLVIMLTLVPLLPKLPFIAAAKIVIWKRLLTCFYGGIFEEIFMRLCLLTLIAWLVGKVWRHEPGKLSSLAFWFANITVALLFGLGHLPSASLVMPITPLVVAAALSLNGIAGVAFGLLYRKYGLESAIIAHFTADFVLWVVGPSFI